jgi:hypothetical protein
LPFNARWRSAKIVVQSLNKQQELAGGIKNALERGEPLAKAKQSFLNAGYNPEEINAAVNSMASMIRPTAQPLPTTPQLPNRQSQQIFQYSNQNQPQPQQSQGLSKTFIIVAIILTVIVLGGAAILGIFWNKIF